MFLRLVALLIASTSAATAVAATQTELDSLASTMRVRLTIVDNKPSECPKQANGCFLSRLELTMPPDLSADLASGDFKLYFGSVSPVIEGQSDQFAVRLINGDLHVLEPRSGAHLRPGQTYSIAFWSQSHFFSAYYPLPNMFLVSGTLAPRVVAATRPVIDPDSGLEVLSFVAPFTDEAHLATQAADDQTRWLTPERAFDLYAQRSADVAAPDVAIIPTPAVIRTLAGAPIDLTKGFRLRLTGFQRPALKSALDDLGDASIHERANGTTIRIRRAPSMKSESYRLTARNAAIEISAADATGARYALESLAQQALHDAGRLRPIEIEDAPRLPFRGLHIDLARNFHSKSELLKLIRQMGRYKLNKLHLHLGDDEGWRLQIRRLPELTNVGAFRCYDPSETRCLLPQLGAGPDRASKLNGFLSQSDYLDILNAAKARGIEVIPSFDMPGHSRAAIKSMEARYRRLIAAGRRSEADEFRLVEPADTTQYRSVQNYNDNTLNVCLETTYRFIDTVIDELKALHAAAGTPLKTYHIGADETAGAWSGSPACKAVMAKTGRTVDKLGPMFIERVSADLARKGIEVAGWSDGLGHVNPAAMPAKVQSNIWSDLFTAASAEAHRHANRGWRTVLGVPNVLYFDMPYAPHPLERGYDWGTRGIDTFGMFRFMPENLPANASVMKDIKNKPAKIADLEPLAPGARLAGMQAQLWSETVRSDAIADYMLFPRLLAFAERAWHVAEWEPTYRPGAAYAYADGQVGQRKLPASWNRFASKLPQHLQQLDKAGIFYRVAPPGARISSGMLEATSELPGQVIEYRVNNGKWQTYGGPARVTGAVQLRTRSYDGRRTSRIVEVSGN